MNPNKNFKNLDKRLKIRIIILIILVILSFLTWFTLFHYWYKDKKETRSFEIIKDLKVPCYFSTECENLGEYDENTYDTMCFEKTCRIIKYYE